MVVPVTVPTAEKDKTWSTNHRFFESKKAVAHPAT